VNLLLVKPLALFVAVAALGLTRAETIDDIARYHVAAIGGRAGIAAVDSLKATGVVRAGGRELSFEMLAQRPNRVRIETRSDGKSLVQGWDGAAPPWRFEPEKSPLAQPMPEAEARAFAGDAEFDDPLIGGRARGYTLDYAGELDWQDRPVWRVLVTRLGEPAFSLLVDRETYFIVARVSARPRPTGAPVPIEERYSDFRPVGGVILPFRIETLIDGQPTQETVLDKMEPQPHLPLAKFARASAPAGE